MAENKFEILEEKVERLEAELGKLLYSDRYLFERDVEMSNGRNFIFSRGSGTKFGTATDQLQSFYGVTPVNQPDTISDPSGQANDLDSEARTAINALIDRLQELGLIQ